MPPLAQSLSSPTRAVSSQSSETLVGVFLPVTDHDLGAHFFPFDTWLCYLLCRPQESLGLVERARASFMGLQCIPSLQYGISVH